MTARAPAETAVFLGPSLPQHEARQLLDALYLPPARRGDIYRLLPSGVKTIVLIDGIFHNTPSVWQRELLAAVDEGVEVFGASSMGALRAAELDRYGVQGHGVIYEWYRDGILNGDDEVALRHGDAEAEYRALSEPLVNIRYTLQRAVESGAASKALAARLALFAKSLYYPDRSYVRLLQSMILDEGPEEEASRLRTYLRTNAVNLKALDAASVLRHVAETTPSRPPREASGQSLPPGPDLWRSARSVMTGFQRGDRTFRGSAILQHARRDALLSSTRSRALIARSFLLSWAALRQVTCPEDFLVPFRDSWERVHDIRPDTPEWLSRSGLTSLEYRSLLAERALADWLTSGQGEELKGSEGSSDFSNLDAALRTAAPESDEPGRVHRERQVMQDWAEESGVTCPDPLRERFESKARERFPVTDLWLEGRGWTQKLYQAWIAREALVEWLLTEGPEHFGLPWSFEAALLAELQLTGEAARLELSEGQE